MARRAPLTATGEPRAPTFFPTSGPLLTSREPPGLTRRRSGRHLTGTFGRPGGNLLSEHIEVESGKNNDLQRLQPCHLARLARNQVRFGLRQAAHWVGAAANASGSADQGRRQLPSHHRHRRGWPARPKASRLPPPPWVLATPEAI